MVALTLLTYVNLIAALLASRMAFDAYGSTDMFALGIFAGGLVLAYLLGGFSNFFLRRPFVSDAVFGIVLMTTVAFVVINFFNKRREVASICDRGGLAIGAGVDSGVICALDFGGAGPGVFDRLEMIPTLAICSGLFLLGLMSNTCLADKVGRGFVVGFGALHHHAKLAAFLARRCVGHRQNAPFTGVMWARHLAMWSAMWGRCWPWR